MRISEKYKQKETVLSFEIFPPKKESTLSQIDETISILSEQNPDYISVTFGAGGSSNNNKTIELARKIKTEYNVDPMVHLTCLCYNKNEIDDFYTTLKESGIENILALRGDRNPSVPERDDFKHADDLTRYLKSKGDDFCIAGACYPETHPEAESSVSDITNLKKKVDAGDEFLVSQLFFDNEHFYRFKEKCDIAGINVPISAGIMPVTNGKQIARSCQLSGAVLPSRFRAIVDKFGDNPKAMRQAGIAYATDQIIDLIANGIQNIHVYSMNKPEVAAAIMSNLSEIVK